MSNIKQDVPDVDVWPDVRMVEGLKDGVTGAVGGGGGITHTDTFHTR